MKYNKSCLTLTLLCASTIAVAQKRITGKVWSEADGPIMMANVVEVDANNRNVSATTTDANGNFSLQVKNNANKIRVSYIGYKTEDKEIGENMTFDIELKDISTFQEAVVTYRRKANSGGLNIDQRQVSGAVQTLDMDNLEGLSFETASDALQGQIAGLDIVSNSGNLGSGSSMRLRGVTSISGSQEPLIVVNDNILEDYSTEQGSVSQFDSQEQFAALLNVQPEDIKSIEVLKDAAATAVWGSRGANGVIKIYTRRGAAGKTKVNFNYSFHGSWQPKGLKMLTGDEYTMMMKEGYFNPAQSSVAADIVELSYRQDRPAYYANYNKNTDWVNLVTQFGQTHKYGVAISGGGDKATFRLSANYDDEGGTIIQQKLDRLSTRLALDYYVSDRMKFSSNFALVFVNNHMNNGNILSRAYNAMPNMAVTRHEYDAVRGVYYDTGEYYRIFPSQGAAGEVRDGYTSYYLRDMVGNGNPVAIAHQAWVKRSNYTIEPEFIVSYQLLGKDEGQEHILQYEGKVFMNTYAETNHGYFPASLVSSQWNENINTSNISEFKSNRFETTHSLRFHPVFANTNHDFQTRIEGQLRTNNSTRQNLSVSGLAGGISDATVPAYVTNTTTSTGEGHSMNATWTGFYSYKTKYNVTAAVRADGSTKFGSGNKWGFFPSISGRWNINEEKFFEPLSEKISLFSLRAGWGINGNQAIGEGTMYNKYTQIGTYNNVDAIAPSGLRLINIRWEKTSSWNIGVNLNLFEDLLQFDLNTYSKKTTDLIMSGVQIPSISGYGSLDNANVGEMKNYGWELNFSTNNILQKLLKDNKMKLRLRFNLAQNINRIEAMDESVLNSLNKEYNYANPNQNWNSRVQIGNALGGVYGFRYKGIYRYDYEHSGYFNNEALNARYGDKTAAAAAARGENATTPVARDAQGNVIYDAQGNPLQMVFNYGGVNYLFSGGDVIYEDVNHDGQINSLDVVYLGSSNPTLNGGFGFTFEYGRWQLNTSFTFRVGNKIINQARMSAESMRSNYNQSAAVNWRWRKNGDITEIPRAMNSNAGASYNALPSDRYVENGDYVRFNYMQLSYSFKQEQIKRWGLNSLRFSLSANNLFFWSKYSGTDPEHSASKWHPAIDDNQTPRNRSFTFNLSFGF
ncbi:MAG: SusC/RagA family TonB-linked outer membrane protein [Bacteroidales bacterium]|nr:SusC/RagA family TonB-linked outer membrane protein [Bacteroidales bacterium]